MDATAEDGLAGRYGIVSYPILKLFGASDGRIVDYEGARDGHTILYYVRKMVRPTVEILHSERDVRVYLEDADDTVVLAAVPQGQEAEHRGYDAAWGEEVATLSELFALGEASSDLLGAHFHLDTHIPESRKLLLEQESQGGGGDPTFFVVLPARYVGKAEQRVFPVATVAQVAPLLESHSLPIVGLLTPDTRRRYEARGLPLVTLYFNVDFALNPTTTRYILNRFRAAASNPLDVLLTRLSFAVGDIHAWRAHLAAQFGERNAPPFIVTIEDRDGPEGSARKFKSAALIHQTHSKFVCTGILPFLRRYLAAEELPFVRSGKGGTNVKQAIDEVCGASRTTVHSSLAIALKL